MGSGLSHFALKISISSRRLLLCGNLETIGSSHLWDSLPWHELNDSDIAWYEFWFCQTAWPLFLAPSLAASHLTTNLSESDHWLLTESSVQVRVVLEVQLVGVEAGGLVGEVEDMLWLDLGLGGDGVDGAVHSCGGDEWTKMTCWQCARLSKTRQLSELNKDCNWRWWEGGQARTRHHHWVIVTTLSPVRTQH